MELIYNYISMHSPPLTLSVMIFSPLTLFAQILENIQNSC